MQKEKLEEYLNLALSTGADFAEIYYEDNKTKVYRMVESKLDSIETNFMKGVGIRITSGEQSFYTSTDILTDENIKKTIKKLTLNIDNSTIIDTKIGQLIDKTNTVKIPHDSYPDIEKKSILSKIDKIARNESELITQVMCGILEMDKNFILVNSKGNYVKGNNTWTRIMASVFASKDNQKERESTSIGKTLGYEILDDFDLEKEIKYISNLAVKKLDAKVFKGGELPVIICPGFGAVIFHEACGHGLEATSVAPHLSVFSDDFGKKIASNKVTLIDDSTIKNSWGSYSVDDEGNCGNKNILIKDGILNSFLVDQFNSSLMNMKSNGCGRRENYRYSTTSRMSNTYLAPGNDKIEDMIKSIDYGVYCESMSGGSVNPSTGDFNFSVETARLIENGKLTDYLKGVALIGNSKDILKNVEMVSDDLKLETGFCGSKSGSIPVTIGQPTIKVSKILVGGME